MTSHFCEFQSTYNCNKVSPNRLLYCLAALLNILFWVYNQRTSIEYTTVAALHFIYSVNSSESIIFSLFNPKPDPVEMNLRPTPMSCTKTRNSDFLETVNSSEFNVQLFNQINNCNACIIPNAHSIFFVFFLLAMHFYCKRGKKKSISAFEHVLTVNRNLLKLFNFVCFKFEEI